MVWVDENLVEIELGMLAAYDDLQLDHREKQ
jgi:hypothetical protein